MSFVILLSTMAQDLCAFIHVWLRHVKEAKAEASLAVEDSGSVVMSDWASPYLAE